GATSWPRHAPAPAPSSWAPGTTRSRHPRVGSWPPSWRGRASPPRAAPSARQDPLADVLRDRFCLEEESEVVAPSGLRIRPAHVEAAERMDPDQGAGAFAVQVEVADVEPPLRLEKQSAVATVIGARQPVYRSVRDLDLLLE